MKTAISIPDKVFRSADALAKRLGITRRELYANAITEFLSKHQSRHVTARLDTVYAEEDSSLSPNLRNVILLVILAAILLIGTALEMLPMLVLMVPVLVPVARQLGFDSIHFGVLICTANVMGGVSPPAGALIFITMGIAKVGMTELNKYIWYFIGAMTIVMVLCVFFPGLVTYFPSLTLAK